jgi:hypothetical protein
MRNLAARLQSHFDAEGMVTDAGETATYARQLEYIQAKVYTRIYADLIARTLFPADSDAGPPEVLSKTWSLEDSVGRAALIHDYSQDFPNVEISGEQVSRKLFSWGVSYSYSFDDLLRAKRAGQDLDKKKAMAARRACEETLERICYDGDNSGLPGLLNTPGTLATAPAAAGTWLVKTGQQIVDDVIAATTAQSNATGNAYPVTDLLIELPAYNRIKVLRYVPAGETMAPSTVLKYIENELGVKVTPWRMLDAPALAAAPKKVFYAKNEDVIALAIQRDFTQESPRLKNLSVSMPCHMRLSGLEIRQPKGVTVMST